MEMVRVRHTIVHVIVANIRLIVGTKVFGQSAKIYQIVVPAKNSYITVINFVLMSKNVHFIVLSRLDITDDHEISKFRTALRFTLP